MNSEKAIIELEDVDKSYHDGRASLRVLSHVNARFMRGDIIAIQGRSGSGKSTLLNLIAGIDYADAGRVMVNNQVINPLNDDDCTMLRRRHIGFVFQSFNLVPTLSVRENLAFPLALNNMEDGDIKTKVDDVLAEFNIGDKKNSYPDQLSGGEQQRVAIARAIIHTPAIVLADEPTGNLDLETEHRVLKLLSMLPEKYGVTVVCVTHSPDVATISNHVYQLENGQLTAGHC